MKIVRLFGAQVSARGVKVNPAIKPFLSELDGSAAMLIVMPQLPTTEDECNAVGVVLAHHLTAALLKASRLIPDAGPVN